MATPVRDAYLITATHGQDPDAHVEAMLSAIAWYREELPRAPIGDQSSVPVERTTGDSLFV